MSRLRVLPYTRGCIRPTTAAWAITPPAGRISRRCPTYLKRLGYRVVLAHKAHTIPKEVFSFEYLPAGLPRNPAIPRTYRMEGLNTKAIDALLAEHARARRDTPLCLIVADSSPHVVWEPNKDFDPGRLKLPGSSSTPT